MNRLTILYDPMCAFCCRCRDWLLGRPKYIELEFLPRGSSDATKRYPSLRTEGGSDVLVVVTDEGGVYRGSDAYIMCLYALVDYRELAIDLAHGVFRPLADRGFSWLSRNRTMLSQIVHQCKPPLGTPVDSPPSPPLPARLVEWAEIRQDNADRD